MYNDVSLAGINATVLTRATTACFDPITGIALITWVYTAAVEAIVHMLAMTRCQATVITEPITNTTYRHNTPVHSCTQPASPSSNYRS